MLQGNDSAVNQGVRIRTRLASTTVATGNARHRSSGPQSALYCCIASRHVARDHPPTTGWHTKGLGLLLSVRERRTRNRRTYIDSTTLVHTRARRELEWIPIGTARYSRLWSVVPAHRGIIGQGIHWQSTMTDLVVRPLLRVGSQINPSTSSPTASFTAVVAVRHTMRTTPLLFETLAGAVLYSTEMRTEDDERARTNMFYPIVPMFMSG
jgi:hypothetical protein